MCETNGPHKFVFVLRVSASSEVKFTCCIPYSTIILHIPCRAGNDLSDGCLEAHTIVSVLST